MKKAFLIMLLLAAAANAEVLNAKAVDNLHVKITYSGTLDVLAPSQEASLSYYIPQEGVEDIQVTADGAFSWREMNDSFGNRLVLMKWSHPAGRVNYQMDITVRNSAKQFFSDTPIGTDNDYLVQTNYTRIDDNIRQMAYPYEKSLKRAAELTKFVYDFVNYNLSYIGRNEPSDVVAVERQGVCVEHANLLAAMLRTNGIPTRYVVGYAYSAVQDKFIGHTWVEVPDSTGEWIPFDPTWMQAGHLDATHIKSASLLDNSQIDTLTYLGGNIRWTRNEEQFDIIDHTEKNITSIKVDGTRAVDTDNFGYIKANINVSECTLVTVSASSCVGAKGKPLTVYQGNRSVWLCSPKDVYWFFKATGSDYICPVVVYDQTGTVSEIRVIVREGDTPKQLSIGGASTAAVNEEFMLTSSDSGIFYSPDFGTNADRNWILKINQPGEYTFYLYSNGGLAMKDVHVLERKDFNLNATTVSETSFGQTFDINATLQNILEGQNVEITVHYTNQTTTTRQYMKMGDRIKFYFKMVANREGWNDLTITAAGNSLASETIQLYTPPRELSIIDKIIGFFQSLIGAFKLAG